MDRIAVIPVRSGSKRLPKKNYLSFNSRTLVEIARDKCLASKIFDKVVITSDDPVFERYTENAGVEFLLRSPELASDEASSDLIVDFLFQVYDNCESLLWVNSVSPLQPVQDIVNCGERLSEKDVDCVMAVNTLYQHCCISNQPINFDRNVAFERTQDLDPVQRYIYSCMGWKRETYVRSRLEGFKGLFPGQISLVEADPLSGMLIKYERDFLLCSMIERALDTVQ